MKLELLIKVEVDVPELRDVGRVMQALADSVFHDVSHVPVGGEDVNDRVCGTVQSVKVSVTSVRF